MLAIPDGSLAQSVEQLAFNQLVEGSNPSRPTTFLPVVKEVEAILDGSLAQSILYNGEGSWLLTNHSNG